MNHGLNLKLENEHIKGDEHLLGASSYEYTDPIESKDLPKGERQRRDDEDKMCCTTMGLHENIESRMNKMIRENRFSIGAVKFLNDNRYLENGKVNLSDRFNANKAGTTRNGNSIKAPNQAFYDFGAIPEAMLPYKEPMSWNDFYSGITKEMEELGKKFREIFLYNFEIVSRYQFDRTLKTESLTVAGYAWPSHYNGVYQRSENRPNHLFMLWRLKYFAVDSYIDSFDGDYIKQLATNYKFLDYGYRHIIRENLDYKWDYPVDKFYGMKKTPIDYVRQWVIKVRFHKYNLSNRQVNALLNYWNIKYLLTNPNGVWLHKTKFQFERDKKYEKVL